MRPWSRIGRAGPSCLALAWLGCVLAGCGAGEEEAYPATVISPRVPIATTKKVVSRAPAPANPTIPQAPSPFRFTEIAREAGIDFRHVSGMTEAKHFPTANASGVAIFDYDGDGLLDLYFATCTYLPLGSVQTPPNRLYKNLGGGQFRDVTESAGVGFVGFNHGIVVGDIDNDGDQDIYLCNYGPNVLYLNNGDGTFRDISRESGTDNPSWSSGGAFLDYDNDGDLDLYVSNYGDWTLERDDHFCGDREKNVRQYCSPKEVRTVKHILYRNDGLKDGIPHFTDVTDQAGVGRADGHGFGVIAADLNGDGKIDLYVANDQNPNFLFLNNGDGTFQDASEVSGAALDINGNAQAGMGVDAEDIDGDGKPELFVTNFRDEYNTLYQNFGNGNFFDQTSSVGLAADSMPWVGWGCGLVDLDNDGWPDIFVANGHVDDNWHLLGQPNNPYRQPPLLHRNVPLGRVPGAGRRFVLATRGAGPYFDEGHVGRGVAFGDLDDDGDLDIVVNHKDAPPALLRNDTPTENCWIRLKLVGTRSNRDAIGARVEVTAGGRTLSRQRKGGGSIMSAHDPRLLIGVGPVAVVEKIVIRWPSGAESILENLETGQTREIIEPAAGP